MFVGNITAEDLGMKSEVSSWPVNGTTKIENKNYSESSGKEKNPE